MPEIILEKDLGGARVSGNARDACLSNSPDFRVSANKLFCGVLRGFDLTQTRFVVNSLAQPVDPSKGSRTPATFSAHHGLRLAHGHHKISTFQSLAFCELRLEIEVC